MKDSRNAGRTFSCARKKGRVSPQGFLPLDVMEVLKTTFASSIMED